MLRYIATFHTYFGAQCFYRNVSERGDSLARYVPAPRALSVSCGTAVAFSIPFEERFTDEDTEAVYIDHDGRYEPIFENH